jgi:hypothetical protein
VHNFTDAGSRDVQFKREPVNSQVKGLHKVLPEDFARMDRRH